MSIFDSLKKGKDIFVDARQASKEFFAPFSPVDSPEKIMEEKKMSLLPSETDKIRKEQAMNSGGILVGDTYVDPLFSGGLKKIGTKAAKEIVVPAVVKSDVFEGFTDLSTHVLEKLKGFGNVSEKFIIDTMQNVKGNIGLKQPEQNIYTNALFDTVENGKVNAKLFADRVKQDLLPLKRDTNKDPGYEGISLPSNLRGDVAEYSEHVYNSPIKVSAGNIHPGLGKNPGYFGHIRVEDLDGYEKGDTVRRVIEMQSDLFQKGRLESSVTSQHKGESGYSPYEDFVPSNVQAEIDKLSPYKDIWHERLIREEVKQAAVDGKTKLQFPTGETAMKIEGLDRGDGTLWWHTSSDGTNSMMDREFMLEDLEVGKVIARDQDASRWTITDVLLNGKFKAVKTALLDEMKVKFDGDKTSDIDTRLINSLKETFDLSGKIDDSNPIYKFYESEVGKYLGKKYNAQKVTDDNGVSWFEVDVDPTVAGQPVKAFGAAAAPLGVSLFQDQHQSTVNEDGSTSESTVPSLLNSLRGKPITYKRNEAPIKETPAPVSELKTLDGEWQGTNYDPYDRNQNRPDATTTNLGEMAVSGVKNDGSMVAVPRKKDGITGMLRLGTVIYVPSLNQKFLVADLKNARYNGQQQIDFPTPGAKGEVSPTHNQSFGNIIVLREGSGKADTRNYVNSGEWEKEKNTPFNVNN